VTSSIEVRLRSATKADDAFIVEMARHACVTEDWPLPEPDSEETGSVLPGDGDVVVLAADATGALLGAAWTFHHDPPLVIETLLPEVVMAVVPEFRGRGVGGLLLDELSQRCAGTYEAICLNVHVRNPAVRLYERKGFHAVGHGRGALGVAMRKSLT
jgi:GNAT superfamily N-acetyltransferase